MLTSRMLAITCFMVHMPTFGNVHLNFFQNRAILHLLLFLLLTLLYVPAALLV